MPLPNVQAQSPRVYKLLKNTDLENLTADNLADVADPISIEMLNEDEFDGWL